MALAALLGTAFTINACADSTRPTPVRDSALTEQSTGQPVPLALSPANLYRCDVVTYRHSADGVSFTRGRLDMRGGQGGPRRLAEDMPDARTLARFRAMAWNWRSGEKLLDAGCVIPGGDEAKQFASEYFKQLVRKHRATLSGSGAATWPEGPIACFEHSDGVITCEDGVVCYPAEARVGSRPTNPVRKGDSNYEGGYLYCTNGCEIYNYEVTCAGGGEPGGGGGEGGGGEEGELSEPGEDIGPETPETCNVGASGIGALTGSDIYAAYLRGQSEERQSGPSAGDPPAVAVADVLALPCFQCTPRQANAQESAAIYQAALNSGEWTYTQGGARGGTEPQKDVNGKVGDCTDFTWKTTMDALGSSWNHGWNQKLNTEMFRTYEAAQLAAHGFARITIMEARPGDIVVRGGHAGVLQEINSNGVMGIANNGLPATSGGQANKDGITGAYNFESRNGINPTFYRPIICN
jgi:hypothetical protein